MPKKIEKNITKIFVEHGKVEEIAKDFDLDRDAVSEALRAVRTTRHGNVIRKIAVKWYGGVEQSI